MDVQVARHRESKKRGKIVRKFGQNGRKKSNLKVAPVKRNRGYQKQFQNKGMRKAMKD